MLLALDSGGSYEMEWGGGPSSPPGCPMLLALGSEGSYEMEWGRGPSTPPGCPMLLPLGSEGSYEMEWGHMLQTLGSKVTQSFSRFDLI